MAASARITPATLAVTLANGTPITADIISDTLALEISKQAYVLERRIAINRLINQFDPPKDLIVTSGFAHPDVKKVITQAISELFGDPPRDKWSPSANKTEYIKGLLLADDSLFKQMYIDRVKIVRLKHSSGHSPAPHGLNLLQDNGPLDIASGPRLIHNAGSVIDPAGKTKKESRNELYTILNLVENAPVFNIFPNVPFTEHMGMSAALNGDITMVHNGDHTYTVTINTPFGKIVERFDETFKPTSGGHRSLARIGTAPSYFAGNPEKNAEILRLVGKYNTAKSLDIMNEIKKYILCKELGDTLEVVWLDFILDIGPTIDGHPILRANTVVGSTDNVVLYRCIANNVGAIHTDSGTGDTWQYMPKFLDEAQMAQIWTQEIEIIRREVVGHNQSVIALLKAVSDVVNSPENRNRKWVEDLMWSEDQFTAGVLVLRQKISEMQKINDDINVAFLAMAPSKASKAAAVEMKRTEKFMNPFVSYKGKYYARIVKVVRIHTRIPFSVKNFLPTEINTLKSQYVLAGGGRRGMVGGAGAEDDPIIMEIVKLSRNPIVAVGAGSAREDGASNHLYDILSANIPIESGINATKQPFLGIIIREFFPELLTYANIMTQVYLLLGLRTAEQVAAVREYNNVGKTASGEPIQYILDDNNKYVFTMDEGDPANSVAFTFDRSDVTLAIAYSNLFLEFFPSICTQLEYEFLTYLRQTVYKKNPSEYLLFANTEGNHIEHAMSNIINTIHTGGGGTVDPALVSSLGISIYEDHYRLETMQTHKRFTTEEFISEKNKILDDVNSLLQSDPDDIVLNKLKEYHEHDKEKYTTQSSSQSWHQSKKPGFTNMAQTPRKNPIRTAPAWNQPGPASNNLLPAPIQSFGGTRLRRSKKHRKHPKKRKTRRRE